MEYDRDGQGWVAKTPPHVEVGAVGFSILPKSFLGQGR